jgi:putative ubiquitin-RnfH superfamily antitoxin RatB of RatAB toxin-antitoxin module
MKTKKIKSIKIELSYTYAMKLCILTLDAGTVEGKAIARAQLLEMAGALDTLKKLGHIK